MLLQPHKSSVVKYMRNFSVGKKVAYSISPPAFASKFKVSIK